MHLQGMLLEHGVIVMTSLIIPSNKMAASIGKMYSLAEEEKLIHW